MNRRRFIGMAVAGGLTASWWDLARSTAQPNEDELVCREKFSLAVALSLQKRPIQEVIIQMGISFLGTDYAAFVLEVPGPERLIVNLRGLDCVSFYENALVLARCVKKDRMTFVDYRNELRFIRYRNGVIDGYPSRLHYTSDYFHDNELKGVWMNITERLGGVPLVKKIHYMTSHPGHYRQLRENPAHLEAMKRIEAEISGRKTFFIPKESLAAAERGIESGDIIGITTDIDGLDVSHTAIAVRQGGALHLLHAPSVGRKVEISAATLTDYLAANKRHTGIMIVRPKEPVIS